MFSKPSQPAPSNESAEERRDRLDREEQRKREKNVLIAFWSTLAAGTASLLIFAYAGGPKDTAKVFALGILVGGAAALLGALLGFLFGLPRGASDGGRAVGPASGETQTQANYEATRSKHAAPVQDPGKRLGFVNNNLLEISDWLTKIIVGAGLVGLKDLVKWLGTVGQIIGEGAGFSGSLAQVFGCSVLSFFFAWGFLFVYIQTRTIISFIFASMERSLQNLGTTIREAVASEVRQSVMPQIERVSEDSILQLLYSNDPGAPAAVVARAQEFLSRPGNEKNGRVWLYLAAAYGQQHVQSDDPEFKKSIADRAFDALKRALEADSSLKNIARGLLYEDDPNHLPGDNDLASLHEDQRFQALLGPPPANR
jgi:hypothetical protein